jgi:hypothetical protein
MILPAFQSGCPSHPRPVAGTSAALSFAAVIGGVRRIERMPIPAVSRSVSIPVTPQPLPNVSTGDWWTNSGRWVPGGGVPVVRRGRSDVEVAWPDAEPDVAAVAGHCGVGKVDALEDQGDPMGRSELAALPAHADSAVTGTSHGSLPKPTTWTALDLLPEPLRQRPRNAALVKEVRHADILSGTSA